MLAALAEWWMESTKPQTKMNLGCSTESPAIHGVGDARALPAFMETLQARWWERSLCPVVQMTASLRQPSYMRQKPRVTAMTPGKQQMVQAVSISGKSQKFKGHFWVWKWECCGQEETSHWNQEKRHSSLCTCTHTSEWVFHTSLGSMI